MSVLLSKFKYFTEKIFDLSTRVWISILIVPNPCREVEFLVPKVPRKHCHVGTLEAFHLWSLATSVKAARSTSYCPPIKLLDFLHLSTEGHSVKTLLH